MGWIRSRVESRWRKPSSSLTRCSLVAWAGEKAMCGGSTFVARGVTHVVECGPGRVLAGMNKRIARELKTFALDGGSDVDATLAALAG